MNRIFSKTGMVFLILLSAVPAALHAQTAKKKDYGGVLLCMSDPPGAYRTLLIRVESRRADVVRDFPFIIYPEKLVSGSSEPETFLPFRKQPFELYDSATSRFLFLLPDTIEYSWDHTSIGLRAYYSLDSALHSKDIYIRGVAAPSLEELLNQGEDSTSASGILKMYENDLLEVGTICAPWITWIYSGGNSGGAHPNWYEHFHTEKFLPFEDSKWTPAWRTTAPQYEYLYQPELNCCELTDSLLLIITALGDSGQFVDGFSPGHEYPHPIEPNLIYDKLVQVNGEPHWIVCGDAFASYAMSGDYMLTVEHDADILHARYRKPAGFEIADPDSVYRAKFWSHGSLQFYKGTRSIRDFPMPPNTRVIAEEWASRKLFRQWMRALKAGKKKLRH